MAANLIYENPILDIVSEVESLPELWCVRSDGGKYTKGFVSGAYVAIGWDVGDLRAATDREQINDLYAEAYPGDTNKRQIAQQVGQIARFLFEIRPGDIVLTPDLDPDLIFWGVVADKPYFYQEEIDEVPFRHRKMVDWSDIPFRRDSLSALMRRSLGCSSAVFKVAHDDNT